MIVVDTIARAGLAVCVLILLLYAMRHYLLVVKRLTARPPLDPMELTGFVQPSISVVIPMHNEERVAADILTAIVESDYDREAMEVIVVDDRSTDRTGAIVDRFAAAYPFITVLHRTSGAGGKPAALEVATARARGDILIVFDADYVPARGLVKRLVVPFCDPQVGAVMGRVVPHNATRTLLSAILELERAAGYQIGQQARQRMQFTPQFGGTVGGVRMSALRAIGGWNTASLTEDTDLTFRLVLDGWKVAYVNRGECYEEVPESWAVRRRQIARWTIGHTECFHRFCRRILTSRVLRPSERIDALFVLGCYLTAPVLVVGWLCSLWLVLFAPALTTLSFAVALVFVGFQVFGSQATFAEMGAAAYLDRNRHRVLLLPLAIVNFFASTVAICDALVRFYAGRLFRRGNGHHWHKTARFRANGITPAVDGDGGPGGGLRRGGNGSGGLRRGPEPVSP
jgi:cellulose synthase/poly-beta-1,6-N-acetylglucosamine synthase-like glycosyltransferase